ncbi:hypothetical protein [Bacillus sp. DX3.1]|uniref:hypothetical protein n=1 Tax=Bacillus sp. DX3.1 TaxID=3052091 RepID=UPI0033656DAD
MHRLVVSKEDQGLNIGSQLVEWAKQKARGDGQSLRLDCVATNGFTLFQCGETRRIISRSIKRTVPKSHI